MQTDIPVEVMRAEHPPVRGEFPTTHWTLVAKAGGRDAPTTARALEELCRAYWHPLYCYIRRRGLAPPDAQDATQEFFCRLLGNNSLASLDRSRGSFRSFLFAAINHVLANEWDKARALKRGGGRKIISLDAEEAEGRYIREAAVDDSAEKVFDRRWALTLLDRALARLREEFTAEGKLAQFDSLKRFLSDVPGDGDYAALATELGIEPGALAVAVHRLRLRYREIVRAEIGQTVSSEADLKAEMRHLFETLD